SNLWRFSVDGTGTRVDLLDPPYLNPYPPPCFDLGSAITFRWGSVPMAESYRLWVHELIGLPGQPWKEGATILVRDYPDDPTTNEQVHTPDLASNPISGPMSGGRDAIGYLWKVQAIRPNGLPGLEGDA